MHYERSSERESTRTETQNWGRERILEQIGLQRKSLSM